MKKFIFEEFCDKLEGFYNGNASEILQSRERERRFLLSSLLESPTKRNGRIDSFNKLRKVFQATEERFAQLCADETIDDIFAILRRAPIALMPGTNWLKYLSVGIAKYSRPTGATIDIIRTAGAHAMTHYLSEDLLLKADTIASLADLMDEVAGVMRWVGKGANLRPTENDPLRLDVSQEVLEAVSAYELRREDRLFQNQGVYLRDLDVVPDLAMFAIGRSSCPVWLHDPKKGISLNVNFPPSIIDWKPIARVLESYREAIEDIFGVSLESISQGLCGISTNILSVILMPDDMEILDRPQCLLITMPRLDDPEEHSDRLSFTFRLLRTGYLRFSRSYWLDACSRVIGPWESNPEKRRDLSNSFFRAFTARVAERGQLDLTTLRTPPFLIEAPSGEIYVDLIVLNDFLEHIVERAKEWFSSQHGDRFTLSVKKAVEDMFGDSVTVQMKKIVHAKDRSKHECDLIINTPRRIIIVECKAHAKSAAYFRGDPSAISSRSSQLVADHAQALSASKAVFDSICLGEFSATVDQKIDYCVCTPTQEFIKPVGKFGWLVENVPRTCTPEELCRAIKQSLLAGPKNQEDN